MKILITGGLGHIGSYLLNTLRGSDVNDSLEIHILDNLTTQRFCSLWTTGLAKYKLIQKSMLEIDGICSFLDIDYNYVIHLAALTNAEASKDAPHTYKQHNLTGTQRITNFCYIYNIPLIFSSTTSVYGTGHDKIWEDGPTKPQSPYAETKVLEERFIEAVLKDRTPYVILRNATIVGVSPGMRFHTAVNKFCFQASMGQCLTIWKGVENQVRPYLNIQKLYHIITNLLLTDRLKDVHPLQNIVSCNLTVKDILDEIKLTISKFEYVKIDSPIMNQMSFNVKSKFDETIDSDDAKSTISGNIRDTLQLFKPFWRRQQEKGGEAVS